MQPDVAHTVPWVTSDLHLPSPRPGKTQILQRGFGVFERESWLKAVKIRENTRSLELRLGAGQAILLPIVNCAHVLTLKF